MRIIGRSAYIMVRQFQAPTLSNSFFDDEQGCGAFATDAQGNNVSSDIVAVDVTPCPSNSTCPTCDIALAQEGLCAPGKYVFLYHSQDSEGRATQELRTVQVAAVWLLNMVGWPSTACHVSLGPN